LRVHGRPDQPDAARRPVGRSVVFLRSSKKGIFGSQAKYAPPTGRRSFWFPVGTWPKKNS
jgi:hypothetical protein